MKKFLSIFTLTICLSASATNWNTYYVYFETDYIQGSWVRADILHEYDYKYLAPEIYEDLFGTEASDFVNKILSRLKEKKPETYDWEYDLTFQGDTVIITSKGQIDELETIKNEIVASLIFNNFKAVTLKFLNKQDTLTIDDLTLPYFDLVTLNPKSIKSAADSKALDIAAIDPIKESNKTQNYDSSENDNNLLTAGLIISGLLNIGLLGLLIIMKRK